MGAEETGDYLVVLGLRGSIDFADAGACALLKRYFEGEKNGRVPELVGAWLRRESTQEATNRTEAVARFRQKRIG